jgi:sterol desaturase/sphingolipid hydroxylase (fatty acid hydroxylase superfamily)
MRLSKVGYFADFFIYPLFVLALVTGATIRTTSHWWLYWSVACLIGIAAWTLLEYIIHRGVLHRVRIFSEMHNMHHGSPTDSVGSPTWLSLSLVCFGVLFPLWWQTNFEIAGGLTAGLMIGYLWYITVHHATHHWQSRPASYLHRAKRRYLVHHYSREPCNFGVSTGFWDHVFGTARHTR